MTPDELKQQAVEASGGLTDFDFSCSEEEAALDETLAALCVDLNVRGGDRLLRAQLSGAASTAVTNLATRLQVAAVFKAHPEIGSMQVPPLVMVNCAARSGSTLLHNLISLHPGARPLLKWELTTPCPPPRQETYATDPRIGALRASLAKFRAHPVAGMHFVDADEPEENAFGFLDGTGLRGVGGIAAVAPTWLQHIDGVADRRWTYRWLRKLLQLLCWKAPPPPGGFLALKCPMSSRHIATFVDAFPEARRVVFLHRDPVRTSISAMSMMALISGSGRSPANANPNANANANANANPNGGVEVQLQQEETFAAMARFVQQRGAGAVVNVSFPELARDPVRVLHGLLEAVGFPLPREQLRRLVGDFIARQRQGKRVKPPEALLMDTPDVLAAVRAQVLASPAVQEYLETFDVESEARRIVDVDMATPASKV